MWVCSIYIKIIKETLYTDVNTLFLYYWELMSTLKNFTKIFKNYTQMIFLAYLQSKKSIKKKMEKVMLYIYINFMKCKTNLQ